MWEKSQRPITNLDATRSFVFVLNHRKYFIFIYNPPALLESEKIWTLSFSSTLFIEYEEIQAWHLKKFFFRILPDKIQNTVRKLKMTNGECIYRKTVDYMSRMTLEKDDFRRFSVIWEFRVTGNWVAARVASNGNGPLKSSCEDWGHACYQHHVNLRFVQFLKT